MSNSVSRRRFLRLSTSLAAGALMAACAPAGEEPVQPEETEPTETPVEPTAAPVEEPITITVLVDDYVEGGPQSEEYMRRHPEVTIEVVEKAGESAKLDSMIAAGTPPDLFVTGDGNFKLYLTQGVLLNLQPMIDADAAFSLDDFLPSLVSAVQGPGGDQYGLSTDFGAQLLWYNKTLFDEAGLSVPDENWTWEDHQSAAAALTQGEGAAKVYGTTPFNWWAPQFCPVWQNQGHAFNDEGTESLMDSEEAIDALAYMLGYVQAGTSASPGELAGMGMETGQLFAGGRAAMLPGGHWEKWQFEDTEDFEWGVTALPKGEIAATFLHTACWNASVETKYPETAWDWIKLTTNDRDTVLALCIEFGGLPWNMKLAKEFLDDPPQEARPHLPKVWNAVETVAESGKNYFHVLPLLEIMDNAWTPAFDKLWNGDLPPNQVGEEIKTGADAILNKYV